MYSNVIRTNTFNSSSIEGGLLEIKLDGELIAQIDVPSPFLEDNYHDTINESHDWFSDDYENSYSISIWSSLGDVSYEIKVEDIEDQKAYCDFRDNAIIDFIPADSGEKNFKSNQGPINDTIQTYFYKETTENFKVIRLLFKHANLYPDCLLLIKKTIIVNIVTQVEKYFSTLILTSIDTNDDLFTVALKNIEELSKHKITLKAFVEHKMTPKQYAIQILKDNISFHNINKVNQIIKVLFDGVSNLNEPEHTELLKIIGYRHEIVHMDGMNIEEDIYLDDSILKFIEIVESYIKKIDNKITKKLIEYNNIF
jgi:hypothetical protein